MMKACRKNGRREGTRRNWFPFLRFIVLFAVIFLLLQRAYINMGERTQNLATHRLNAVPAAAVLNVLIPGKGVVASDAKVIGRGCEVTIRKGCEGFEVFFILAAGMIAYPMRWSRKIMGLLVGAVFVYVLNIIRIISLFCVVWLWPGFFDAAHIMVWQTILILLSLLFFSWWIGKSPLHGSAGGPASRTPNTK
ncbi:MAG: archaeosortase/exosortase family protein [Verrucomicrobia bacterium]|nr:archaeosortase/exosortase family protein [Verrucomicrobiota bacterium]